MKSVLLLIPSLALILAGCTTPATSSSGGAPASASAPAAPPSLPFGELRVVSPAKLDRSPVPEFMPSPFELQVQLQNRKLTGEATLRFTVSKQGKVEQIQVVQSTNPELGKLAAVYAARLVFRPAQLGRTAVACEMEMPFFHR